jgi:hypothetical protein
MEESSILPLTVAEECLVAGAHRDSQAYRIVSPAICTQGMSNNISAPLFCMRLYLLLHRRLLFSLVGIKAAKSDGQCRQDQLINILGMTLPRSRLLTVIVPTQTMEYEDVR